MLKRSILFIALAGAYSLALAGGMGCNRVDISVPCNVNTFSFGVDGLYLRNNANQWTVLDTNFSSASGWGYRIHGAYYLADGRDFRLAWVHFDKITASSQQQTSKMDIIKLEIGQSSRYADNVNVRLSGGVEYARLIDSSPSVILDGDPAGNNGHATAVGPFIGISAEMAMLEGLSLFTDGSLAQLYNHQRAAPAFKNSINHFSSRAGLEYEQGPTIIRVGYQVDHFYHANVGSGDLAWAGPFLGLQWHG